MFAVVDNLTALHHDIGFQNGLVCRHLLTNTQEVAGTSILQSVRIQKPT